MITRLVVGCGRKCNQLPHKLIIFLSGVLFNYHVEADDTTFEERILEETHGFYPASDQSYIISISIIRGPSDMDQSIIH